MSPSTARSRPSAGAYESFYALLERPCAATAPLPVDPADGVAVLEVIDAARASAAERVVVAL